MGGKLSALDPMEVEVPELNNLLERDGYLRPYEREYRRRFVIVYVLNIIICCIFILTLTLMKVIIQNSVIIPISFDVVKRLLYVNYRVHFKN